MRYLLWLIILIGILFMSFAGDISDSAFASFKGKEISYFACTSNPPLSAIEDSVSNITVLRYDLPTHSKKRFGIYIIAGFSFNSLWHEIKPDIAYHFLEKSTSLFLLNHFSQSLFEAFLR